MTELIKINKEKDVVPYAVGAMTASVCVKKELTIEEITIEFNRISPSGTENGWMLSEDTHFRQGETNPCPCNDFPNERLHYLFNC